MRRAFPFLILLLLASHTSLADVPRLFTDADESVTPASLAQAVNHFVDVGEDATIRELEGLAGHRVQLALVCRILFTSKTSEPLHGLSTGAPTGFPQSAMRDWPLFPLARSGSSYFALASNFVSAGQGMKVADYLKYCREKGVFRKDKIPLPTREQAIKDATTLHESKEWKDIKWTESFGGKTNEFSEEREWKFILKQAEEIR